jgi:hypothetical protein
MEYKRPNPNHSTWQVMPCILVSFKCEISNSKKPGSKNGWMHLDPAGERQGGTRGASRRSRLHCRRVVHAGSRKPCCYVAQQWHGVWSSSPSPRCFFVPSIAPKFDRSCMPRIPYVDILRGLMICRACQHAVAEPAHIAT